MPRTYSPDEVQAILAHALERGSDRGDALSHEDLLAVGRELGISESAIEEATRGVGDSLAVKREVDARLRARRRGFVSHLVPYLLVNAMLILLNLQVGGVYWFFWPLFGWGIGLVLHARAAFFPDRPALEAKARRKLERDREREERRARRGGRQVEDAAKDVVAGALGLVADALHESRKPRPTAGARVRDASERSRSEGRAGARVAADGARVERERRVSFEPEEEEAATRNERRRER